MPRKNTKERWRPIPGYSHYDVSDMGRVRTWSSGNAKLMKVKVGMDGYPRITLQDKSGKKKVKRVHNLVARAFIGPSRGRLVRHKSRSKKASLSNLEYGNHRDNHNDKYRDGTDQLGEKNSKAILINKQVREIYKLKGKMSQSLIAEMYGISRQAVSDIHRGATWSEVTGA